MSEFEPAVADFYLADLPADQKMERSTQDLIDNLGYLIGYILDNREELTAAGLAEDDDSLLFAADNTRFALHYLVESALTESPEVVSPLVEAMATSEIPSITRIAEDHAVSLASEAQENHVSLSRLLIKGNFRFRHRITRYLADLYEAGEIDIEQMRGLPFDEVRVEHANQVDERWYFKAVRREGESDLVEKKPWEF